MQQHLRDRVQPERDAERGSRAAAHNSAFARARVPGPARSATSRAKAAACGGTDDGCHRATWAAASA